MFESPEAANLWFDIFNGVLLTGAFLVAVGTWGTIKTAAVKERFSDERVSANELETKRAIADSDAAREGSAKAHERIAELSTQAEGLKKDTAEANAQAAKAQLELQKLQSWRTVDAAKFNAKLVGVEAPTGVEILYVPECSDCFMVAGMIAALLTDKKWPYSLSELKKLQSPPDWMVTFPATLQHRANPTGVSVLSKNGRDPQEKTPANALMSAIGSALDASGFMTVDETIPEGVVRVVIAPKI